MEVVFGIYFGNSSCCVAVNKENKVNVVANAGGERVTPAVVSILENEILTGVSAKQGLARNANRSIAGVLRDISSTERKAPKTSLTCPPVWDDDGDVSYSVATDSGNKSVQAVNVIKQVFMEIKSITSSQNSSTLCTACLCLPAWVTKKAVNVVRGAAKEAGFHIVGVILQPTAACLAYSLEQDRTLDKQIVSIHLGETGGVGSLVEVSGGLINVKDTITSTTSSGSTLTNKLVDHLAKEFYMKYRGDPKESKRSLQKLYKEAENVKQILSTRATTSVNVESLWEGVDFSCPVSRARFEGLISSTLNELLQPTLQMLARQEVDPQAIDEVILSGGTCKIPRLQSLIGDLFPSAQVTFRIPPDEVSAYGAAIEARAVTTRYSEKKSNDNSQVNGTDSGVENGKEKSKKKKKRVGQTERRKQDVIRSHLPVMVSAVAVPVWCKTDSGDSADVCVLPRLTPPLLHYNAVVPVITTGGKVNLTIYEAKAAVIDTCVSEDLVLAQVEFPLDDNSKELNISSQLKPNGSLEVCITEPSSKVSRKFVIANDEESDSC